ncbi:hypothetical protein Tco_0899825 [Tanacetum coccineum]
MSWLSFTMLKLGDLGAMRFGRSDQANRIGPSTALKMTVPSTAKEKTYKKNDVKAKTRFGGNEATKKTQKVMLKQQYENFNASSSESLDSVFNRLQKLVSRLAILGVVTSLEDLNVKFLRSLL